MAELFCVDVAADEESSYQEVVLSDGQSFRLLLAENDFNENKKTLFATHLWSGSITLANFVVTNLWQSDVRSRSSPNAYTCDRSTSFVELGAAAGLPSLAAMRMGGRVVATDFPAEDVLRTLRGNIERERERAGLTALAPLANIDDTTSKTDTAAANGSTATARATVLPHMWGSEVCTILEANGGERFDYVLCAECLWKSDTHVALLTSISRLLQPRTGRALLTFSHHHPGREDVDLSFFRRAAQDFGLHTVHVEESQGKHMWSDAMRPMFLYELQLR